MIPGAGSRLTARFDDILTPAPSNRTPLRQVNRASTQRSGNQKTTDRPSENADSRHAASPEDHRERHPRNCDPRDPSGDSRDPDPVFILPEREEPHKHAEQRRDWPEPGTSDADHVSIQSSDVAMARLDENASPTREKIFERFVHAGLDHGVGVDHAHPSTGAMNRLCEGQVLEQIVLHDGMPSESVV